MNFISHTQGESILIFYNSSQFLIPKHISLIILERLISVIGLFLCTGLYWCPRITYNAEATQDWEENGLQLTITPSSRCLGAQPLCCFCDMGKAKGPSIKLRTLFWTIPHRAYPSWQGLATFLGGSVKAWIPALLMFLVTQFSLSPFPLSPGGLGDGPPPPKQRGKEKDSCSYSETLCLFPDPLAALSFQPTSTQTPTLKLLKTKVKKRKIL